MKNSDERKNVQTSSWNLMTSSALTLIDLDDDEREMFGRRRIKIMAKTKNDSRIFKLSAHRNDIESRNI